MFSSQKCNVTNHGFALKIIMLLPFLDLTLTKISPRLVHIVRILMDLALDHQREDTRHLNFPHTDLLTSGGYTKMWTYGTVTYQYTLISELKMTLYKRES